MRTQSIDTSPDAERVLIEMIRKAPITKRFAFVQAWTASMVEAGSAVSVHFRRGVPSHALDTLVVDWHGQGPTHLPGGIEVTRRDGRLRHGRPATALRADPPA